jgi:Phage tail assembly chaperone proteins, E, or 41 or 14
MIDLIDLPELPEPSFTIDLEPPVVWNGGEFKQLVLREPRTGEVRQADEQLRGGITQAGLQLRSIHLVSKVSGVPVPVIELMGISRLNLAMAYLGPFLNFGPKTG